MKPSYLLYCCAALLWALSSGCGEVVPGDTLDAGADAGEVDPCETELCECDANPDCGSHEFCDTSGPGRVCACVVGYADDGSGSCVWGVAPEDPSFEDPSKWTARDSAGVSPLSTGDIAPGEAFMNTDATCALGGVSQEVTMPAYEDAEPFVALFNYQSIGGGGGGMDAVGAALAINGNWKTFPYANSWRTERLCLGANGYGGPVTFDVSVEREPFDCGFGTTASVAVDHLEVIPADAGECPALGEALNGEFEDVGNWEGSSSNMGITEFSNTGGNGGSRAYHIGTTRLCSGASVTGKVSVPNQALLPSPALDIWWYASNGDTVNLSMNNTRIGQLTGTGPTSRTTRVCVPPGFQGSVVDLTFGLPYSSGSCANTDIRDAYIDSVRFVSDPACGADQYIVDGGFEAGASPGMVPAWRFDYQPGWGIGEVLRDSMLARTGSGVLRLTSMQDCYDVDAIASVVVPPSDGTDGPALKFWYQAGNNPETRFVSFPGNGDLAENGNWRQETVCLDPKLAGRSQSIRFTLDPGGGTCATTFPPEYAYIDDVELTTDSICPTE